MVHFRRRTPQFFLPPFGGYKQNTSHRFASVEIEVSKLANRSKAELIDQACREYSCSVVADGSLPETGFEINTSPAAGDLLAKQLRDICGALGKAGAMVDYSCGMHIHADARDLSWYDISKLAVLYSKVEKTLFAMVPAHRRRSHYATPCGTLYADAMKLGKLPAGTASSVRKALKAAFARGVYSSDQNSAYEKVGTVRDLQQNKSWRRDRNGFVPDRERGDRYHTARYHALNLHSWVYRGTVELRLPNGAVSFRPAFNWARLWASIVDAANSWSQKTVDKANAGKKTLIDIATSARQPELASWIEHRIERYRINDYREED